ncbi:MULTISPECIES: hypothetical protein [unclassified Curtobacterium]|uniref:hypothetical protein n=1 Tax=unclassified Curtobacterium TaxID=257496 RepID=UPI000DA8B574|nr:MULTISPECIES: hypothetical protein [unclassified Curtobacterium]PZE28152.1 hypothetical protein DEI86_06110 [Curtobacterium sp. MCBD17_028]PZF62235.1 hypothetical protein DEI92_01680 [Curtobacterium sp. MCBD17_034]PZM40058.1 hypothetical protein DEI90_04425 [Curtobacterium sp. MCBD17_031]WIE54901.1 hypothetical protein DEI88_001470 [Curtobacterium sp. MCBD17_003]
MSKVEADIRKEQKQRTSVIGGAKAPRTGKQSRVKGGTATTGGSAAPATRAAVASSLVGREPRVDLLPTEVHLDRRERAVARRAWLGVVVLAVVVLLVAGGATVDAIRSRTDLATAQNETTSLLLEQQKYAEVRTLEGQIALLEAGQTVGGSTEIDWSSMLGNLASYLPSGVTITSMTITSANATVPFAQSTSPLDASRVAAIQVSVSSTSVPSVPDWTDRLSKLKGYVDSSIASIDRASDGDAYTASISVDLDEKAYDGKYTGSNR